jgi:hypothetical protein
VPGDQSGNQAEPPPGYGTPPGYGAPQGYGTPPPYQGQAVPGASYGMGPVGSPPPSYLGWAIAAMIGGVLFSLLLGFPTGLAANRYARRVKRAWNAGDQQGALQASKRARTWSIISTVLDLLGLVLVIYVLNHPTGGTTG